MQKNIPQNMYANIHFLESNHKIIKMH